MFWAVHIWLLKDLRMLKSMQNGYSLLLIVQCGGPDKTTYDPIGLFIGTGETSRWMTSKLAENGGKNLTHC